MKVLLIIPAYNEAENLEQVIDNVIKTCPSFDYLIVNDGSTDRTGEICRIRQYHHISFPSNQGIAAAFRAGIQYAYDKGYDYAVQVDADGQHRVEYIQQMLSVYKKDSCDVVIASRFLNGAHPYGLKRAGRKAIQIAIKLVCGTWIWDPTSGMRMFNRKTMEIYIKYPFLRPEPETLAFFIRKKLRIRELYAEMDERTKGESYLNAAASIRYMVKVLYSTLVSQWFYRPTKQNKRYLQYDEKTLKQLHAVLMEILLEFKSICEANNLSYFLVYGTAIGAARHRGFIPWDDDLDVGMPRKDYERFIQICKKNKNGLYELLSVKWTPNNCSTLLKFEKRNSTFVAEHSRYLKNHIGIGIDIFPFDNVIDDDKILKGQMLRSLFWGRLLFLRGTPCPDIPYKGVKSLAAKGICFCMHYLLKGLRVSPKWIFNQFEKEATRYSHIKTKCTACFIAPVDTWHRWKKEDMYPLCDIEFENHTFKVPSNNHQLLQDTYGDYMKLPPEEERVNHRPYKLSFHDRI